MFERSTGCSNFGNHNAMALDIAIRRPKYSIAILICRIAGWQPRFVGYECSHLHMLTGPSLITTVLCVLKWPPFPLQIKRKASVLILS